MEADEMAENSALPPGGKVAQSEGEASPSVAAAPILAGSPGAAPVVDGTGHLIAADDFRHGTAGGVIGMN